MRAHNLIAVIVSASLLTTSAANADFNQIVRVNISDANTPANADAVDGAATPDGRYVVFSSAATNIASVANTLGAQQVYLKDRQTGSVEVISSSSSQAVGNGTSSNPSISDDGRFVTFQSDATNLVNSDTNGKTDIFLRDRTLSQTTLISIKGSTPSDGNSLAPEISADGAFIAFESVATNLIDTDTNAKSDVFVYRRSDETIARVSVSSASAEGNNDSTQADISGDGNLVVFSSTASNLVSSDTNALRDVFIRNRTSSLTQRMSVALVGTQSNGASSQPSISADGSRAAFVNTSTNLINGDTSTIPDILTFKVSDSSIARASKSASNSTINGAAANPALSTDGRYVAFDSVGTNLTNADTNTVADTFIADTQSGTVVRASVGPSGTQGNGASTLPFLVSTGRYLLYLSAATNLISSDSNSKTDVFVLDNECLLGLTVTPPTDTDGDTTSNCSDGCPLDATKIAPGTCGCGTADVDTDSDGTLDCDDACPSDAAKTAAGICGCGSADTDGNGNGQPDCQDPTVNTVPFRPSVQVFSTRRQVKITFPGDFVGVTYRATIKKGKKTVKTFSTRALKVTLKNQKSGSYSITYTVSLGGITSKPSKSKTYKLR